MNAAEAGLVAALGGNKQVTPQQRILLDRCVYKLAKCVLFEIADFSGNMEAGAASDKRYLAWANSLRRDLETLGLERRQRQMVDLTAYIQSQ